ncbi:putative tRNA-splicing endonuclease subunit tsp-4 [Escovopsis weberi]|uniref:tRNA-splicing endonuclease subunit Sen34 n=1 Tax=Escovopsis weberi TaxID=150374 RepID=A0A0N0RTR6_ESCWE|nr:putative tRNA-splicing endonuclease subunit tsp-4 [Escovopsis weberi]
MDAKPIRIATIAGRYLVFDPDAVASLRRAANTNGTLVGTAPQQPTQNIFLGLPIELRPEEAHALVAQGAAFIVDNTAAHTAALGAGGSGSSSSTHDREAYIVSLRRRKLAAHKVYVEMNAKRASQAAAAAAASRKGSSDTAATAPAPAATGPPATKNQVNSLAVTPTCSSDLVPPDAYVVADAAPQAPRPGPLCGFLQGAGYFMTPGLRFGANYSVYPGDPLRFHAHFMANHYGWDEEIPILDIVGGGRLATAVKKAFLVGGEEPGAAVSARPAVRTFSIEWAGM